MLRYLVPLLITLSAATPYQDGASYSQDLRPSAASASQIKFAEENKYDDTGPGAMKQEYAYNTYKTLEDALIAYLDDPDTKLPEHERAKAVQKLLKGTVFPTFGSADHYPKIFNNPSAIFPQSQQEHNRSPFSHYDAKTFYITGSKSLLENTKPEKKPEPLKIQKFHSVKGSPLTLAHYTRNRAGKSPFDDFYPFPQYSYAYGIHDKSVGDLKHVAENRDGNTVRGFYSFIDANGKHQTIHYTGEGKDFVSISKIPLTK